MCTAACAAVDALDGDDAELAVAVARLAEPGGFGRVLERHRDAAVLHDEHIGAAFDGGERGGVEILAGHIDGIGLITEVHANGGPAKFVGEQG